MATGRYEPVTLEHKHAFNPDDTPRLHNLEGVDLLVVQRARHPKFLEWVQAAKSRGIPVVYETDDDLLHVPKHNPAFTTWGSKSARKVCLAMLQEADHVIVSTVPLGQAMREAVDGVARKLTVAHNHLHPDVWGEHLLAPVERAPNDGHLIIGYQGSITHNADVAVAVPALQQILETFPSVRLRFFGTVPTSIRGKIPTSRFDFLKGVEFEQYPRNLRHCNFDISLAPLIDSRFNRCKSNLKVLDAAATRVPTVASNVYPYAQTITHGVDGFLASTTEEWYDALAALILDADLRQRVASAAHTMAWSRWSNAQHGQTWVNLFDRLTGQAHAQ